MALCLSRSLFLRVKSGTFFLTSWKICRVRSEVRLTCAEVGELSGDVGPLILVQFAQTAQRSEAHRGNI